MNSVESLRRDFLDFEEKNKLFKKEINDCHFWDRFRFDIYRRLLKRKNVIDEPHSNPSTSYLDIIKGFIRGFFHKNPFLVGEKDLVFEGHPRRKKMEDGLWWDIYCDHVIEGMEYDYAYIEPIYQKKHKKPAKTDTLKHLDLVIYLSRILRKILGFKLEEQDRDILKEIESKFDDKFGIESNLTDFVEYNIGVREYKLPLYKKLLERANPEMVIIVPGYGKETLIEACSDLGITTVELQHAVIDEGHIAYNYPESFSNITFPDYLLLWGDYWKDKADFPIPDERLKSVGYPFFEERKEKYENLKEENQILFISQGSVGRELSKFAIDLEEEISDYEIVYKLHPGEFESWKEKYPWLQESNIKVVDDEEPLYRLFVKSKVQVGVYSTAIYEGLGFGLETFLVNLPGIESMSPLIEEGFCTKVGSSEELVSQLGREDNSSIPIDRFFRQEARHNILDFIRTIIDD